MYRVVSWKVDNMSIILYNICSVSMVKKTVKKTEPGPE